MQHGQAFEQGHGMAQNNAVVPFNLVDDVHGKQIVILNNEYASPA
jgi:hypothetical protein